MSRHAAIKDLERLHAGNLNPPPVQTYLIQIATMLDDRLEALTEAVLGGQTHRQGQHPRGHDRDAHRAD